jgi:hypothetical protein
MRAMLAFVVFLSFVPLSRAVESICPADYYPFTPGLEREYVDFELQTRVERVLGVESGTGLFMLENPTPWEPGSVHYWACDDRGLTLYKEVSSMQTPYALNPPITKFPDPMEIDVQYEQTSELSGSGLPPVPYLCRATFLGIEDHAVDGTNYPLCAKVAVYEYSELYDPGSGKTYSSLVESTEWWAPAVGPVEKQVHFVADQAILGHTDVTFASLMVRFFTVPPLDISRTLAGETRISWNSLADVTYTVCAHDGTSGPYTELPAVFTGSGGLMEWIDDGSLTGAPPTSPSVTARFYRLRADP